MKQEFEKAEIEVIRFEENNDVITASSVGGAGDSMIDDGDEN